MLSGKHKKQSFRIPARLASFQLLLTECIIFPPISPAPYERAVFISLVSCKARFDSRLTVQPFISLAYHFGLLMLSRYKKHLNSKSLNFAAAPFMQRLEFSGVLLPFGYIPLARKLSARGRPSSLPSSVFALRIARRIAYVNNFFRIFFTLAFCTKTGSKIVHVARVPFLGLFSRKY